MGAGGNCPCPWKCLCPWGLTGQGNAIYESVELLLCNDVHLCWKISIKWFIQKTWRVIFYQGENGGMVTMSNLTYIVSREENGLSVSCEVFNKGTHFSSIQSKTVHVFCKFHDNLLPSSVYLWTSLPLSSPPPTDPPYRVWLDVPPEDATLQSGDPIHLMCLSSGGNPRGQLTWFKVCMYKCVLDCADVMCSDMR